MIEIAPDTGTNEWFADSQDLFDLAFEKCKELEQPDQIVEGMYVSACRAWIKDDETDPRIQNANIFRQYYNRVENKNW